MITQQTSRYYGITSRVVKCLACQGPIGTMSVFYRKGQRVPLDLKDINTLRTGGGLGRSKVVGHGTSEFVTITKDDFSEFVRVKRTVEEDAIWTHSDGVVNPLPNPITGDTPTYEEWPTSAAVVNHANTEVFYCSKGLHGEPCKSPCSECPPNQNNKQ